MIKVCGVRRQLSVLEQCDYIGHMCTPVSKRYMTPEDITGLHYQTQQVAVFVDQSIDEIVSTCKIGGLTTIQLHGQEDVAFCRTLQQLGYSVIKALPAQDHHRARAYADVVDLFIFDGSVPGSGQRYDYRILQDMQLPFLVAGGIGADNVAQVLSTLPNCLGVDCSSRVETDGYKDPKKIADLLDAVESWRS